MRSVDHPNIVKLHEIYLDHDYLHIVTELLDGGEISGKFTEREAARIVRQALQALKYLHDLKIAHRDLKTENMIFCKNRQFVKLIDFGLSKFCSSSKFTATMGTPDYTAPEVLKGKYTF